MSRFHLTCEAPVLCCYSKRHITPEEADQSHRPRASGKGLRRPIPGVSPARSSSPALTDTVRGRILRPDILCQTSYNFLCWASVPVDVPLRPSGVQDARFQRVEGQAALEEAASSRCRKQTCGYQASGRLLGHEEPSVRCTAFACVTGD